MTVDEIEVGDPPEAWTRSGFSVDPGDTSRVGGVRIRLTGRDTGSGILGVIGINALDVSATATWKVDRIPFARVLIT